MGNFFLRRLHRREAIASPQNLNDIGSTSSIVTILCIVPYYTHIIPILHPYYTHIIPILHPYYTHITPILYKVLWLRNRPPFWSNNLLGFVVTQSPPGDGVTTKKLKELIRQPTSRLILPHPRYFYNKVLKLRFIVNRHFVFPYTNYTSA